jgi:hypothetical protein
MKRDAATRRHGDAAMRQWEDAATQEHKAMAKRMAKR